MIDFLPIMTKMHNDSFKIPRILLLTTAMEISRPSSIQVLSSTWTSVDSLLGCWREEKNEKPFLFACLVSLHEKEKANRERNNTE